MALTVTNTSNPYDGSNNFCPGNLMAQTTTENSTNVHAGRLKESTMESSHDLKCCIELATEEAAEMYSQKRKEALSRVKRGELTAIIQLCKSNHSIPEKKIKFIMNVFEQGLREESLKEFSVNTSPMNDIEHYLVELIGQLENMRAPISCRQGLALANSIISGTSHESRVIAWNKKSIVTLFKAAVKNHR